MQVNAFRGSGGRACLGVVEAGRGSTTLRLGVRLQSLVRKVSRVSSRLAYFERWLIVGTVVGVVAGYFATLFYWMLIAVTDGMAVLMGLEGGYRGDFSLLALDLRGPQRLLIPVIVALGAFLGGLLVYRFAPEAEGHGTDAVISAFHRKAGIVNPQVPFVKAVASALTVGLGGSGGVEGPSAQMGGGLGSLVARILRYNVWDRRTALVAGMAAALSAIFRAPIGTALFAVEVLYKRDLEVQALVPAIIASAVAYTVTAPLWGYMEVFPKISLSPSLLYNVESLAFYALLGVFVAPFAVAYVTLFSKVSENFKSLEPKLKLLALKPALGGLIAGLIGLTIPHALGSGRGLLATFLASPNTVIGGAEELGFAILVGLAIAKMFATSFSIGSGGSGGVFAPSITIGALLGYAYGLLVQPYSLVPPLAYAYLGMAAFFSAASKVPLATSVMVAEMSGSYHLLVPALISSVIARELAGSKSIYESQVHHRPRPEIVSLELVIDQLLLALPEAKRIRAADVANTEYKPLRLNDTVSEALELMMRKHQHVVPIVDGGGRFMGVLDSSLLGLLLELPRTRRLASMPLRKPPIVHVDENIVSVAEQLISNDIDYAIVVNGDGTYHGVVTVSDITAVALGLVTGLSEKITVEKREGKAKPRTR